MLPDPPTQKRKTPQRRNVRLGCMVRLGDREVHGHTVNLSPSGAYVRIPIAQLDGLPPLAVGGELAFRLLIPNEPEPLYCTGDVVWVNPDDRAGELPTLGLGLTLFAEGAGGDRKLSEFLADFRYRVVAVESDPALRAQMVEALEADYRVVCFSEPGPALAFAAEHDLAALLVGEPLAEGSIQQFLARCDGQLSPGVARIVISRGDSLAVMQASSAFSNVYYYLSRPVRTSELQQIVRRGVDAFALAQENERLTLELEQLNQRLQRANTYLRRRLEPFEAFEGIIGQSESLREALTELHAIRLTDATVHVHGETGTGKELVARALHFGGARARGPFVAQNCAGMSESLLQSTLFGHRRGAFTGATRDQRGVFEQAHGGTLFLDEVAELSPSVQAALVRTLENAEVLPIGANAPVKVDVRVVSATHQKLRELVRAGRFREDLVFRLLVVEVHLPPLRERTGDVPMLAERFLQLHCEHHGQKIPGFAPEALAAMERYPWPGNVRELQNEIERLVAMADDGRPIAVHLLSAHIRDAIASRAAPPPPSPGGADIFSVPADVPYDEAIARLETALISRAMAEAGGRLGVAAQLLRVERSRLGKLRRRLGLSPEEVK